MRWDVRFKVEETMVGYLRTKCSGDIRISAPWERESMEYPCVVPRVTQIGPVSENAEQHDPRAMIMDVYISTELAPELAPDGTIFRTPREVHADVLSQVGDALFVPDLLQRMIDGAVPGVAFSMAQFSGEIPTLEAGKMTTVIQGEIIAEPVEV